MVDMLQEALGDQKDNISILELISWVHKYIIGLEIVYVGIFDEWVEYKWRLVDVEFVSVFAFSEEWGL